MEPNSAGIDSSPPLFSTSSLNHTVTPNLDSLVFYQAMPEFTWKCFCETLWKLLLDGIRLWTEEGPC